MASFPTGRGVDVFGVDSGSHGRNCSSHHICGQFVKVGDYLYCKWAVQKFDAETPEACVQLHKLATDGHVGCHVGYLPRRLIKSSRNSKGVKDAGKQYEGTWLKVVKDLRLSDNAVERSRSHRNLGIVHCHVADEGWLLEKDPFEVTIEIPEADALSDCLLTLQRDYY